jgi:putative hydrolase of the HAD superfamily
MPIRALVFDIGGVFFPWPAEEYFTEWGKRLGVDGARLWHGPDIEAANLGGITAEEYSRRCAARLDVQEAAVHALMEHAFAGEVNEEMVAFAYRLRPRYRLAALTNTWSFGRALIERKLPGLFDLVVSSAEEGVRKPTARIYEILLERLGAAPGEVVFVDDVEENLTPARALGMRCVRFASTAQTAEELAKMEGE